MHKSKPTTVDKSPLSLFFDKMRNFDWIIFPKFFPALTSSRKLEKEVKDWQMCERNEAVLVRRNPLQRALEPA